MPVRKWDSGLIVRTIRKYHREGKDVSYNAMASEFQGLVSAANYYHGSYREAVKMAGIDYAAIRHKPYWNADRIIKLIRKSHRQGEELHWSKVSARRDELGWAAKAAIREWGTWNKALAAAGLDPAKIGLYRHWGEKAILRELKSRAKRKQPLNSKIMQEELSGLYGSAVRKFGSYEAALAKAGINPQDVAQRREWSRELVCSRLRDFERSMGEVNQVALRASDSGLLRAIRIFFGDLPAAVKAAGVKRYTESRRGRRPKSQKPAKAPTSWRKRRSPAPAKRAQTSKLAAK